MAKAKAKAKPRAQPVRRRHQADAERWHRLLIVGGVAAVIVIAAGVIVFGWYQTQIKPLGKTVLQVGEIEFSLGHLERRMSLMYEESPFFQQGGQGLLALPDTVMFQLEREGKLLEAAGELNISVSEEEVAAEIRDLGGLAEDVEPNLFAEEFRRQVEESGLKESEYRQKLKAELLEEKVRNYFVYLAPAEEPQVRGRYLVLDDETKAQEALGRLQAGEDFATVASQVSVAGGTGQQQGEIDWSPRGGLAFAPKEVEDFLFEAQPGQLSDVIPVSDFFYIAQLLERDDRRPLDDQQRPRVAEREMDEWLDGLSLTVERNFTEEDAVRALEDIL